MTMLSEIAFYLADEGVATPLENLFVGTMPDEPDTCITLYEYRGLPPVEGFGDDLPSDERPSLQVKVRSRDYQEAETLCRAAWLKLLVCVGLRLRNGGDPEEFAEVTLEPRTSPFSLGQDGPYVYIACNFGVLRELVT